MFRLEKSYRLLRFLNSRPPKTVCAVIAAASWLLTFALTGRRDLATMIGKGVWTRRDMKRTMRRLAWIAARSRYRLRVLSDPLFDVTEGTSEEDRNALLDFVERNQGDTLQDRLDRLTLLAGDISLPMPIEIWTSKLAHVAELADKIFDDLTFSGHEPSLKTGQATGDFSADSATAALADFCAVFPTKSLPWFVISGTFLGLVRENGFLAHDLDIDLGVFSDQVELDDFLHTIEQRDCFEILDVCWQESIAGIADGMVNSIRVPALVKLRHSTGVQVDLFWHYREPDVVWHGSHLHRWENSVFDIRPYEMAGLSLYGPADADRYLTENYGDWRTPRTGFNASAHTPNLFPVNHPVSLSLFIRRAAVLIGGGAKIADALKPLEVTGYVTPVGDSYRLSVNRLLQRPDQVSGLLKV